MNVFLEYAQRKGEKLSAEVTFLAWDPFLDLQCVIPMRRLTLVRTGPVHARGALSPLRRY